MARRRRHLFLALAAALVAVALPAPASAAASCDLVAAASGNDEGPGTADAPFATPGRLARALEPGQTGCVRDAVKGSMWIEDSNVTLTSEPGHRGTVVGQIVIDADARGVSITDVDIDGTGQVRPTTIVLGDDALLRGIDLTTNGTQGICMILGTSGHDGDHLAERTRIESSRIHDCGVTNNHQHGIYVEHAADTRIVGNAIYDNADRGIQLYPDAQNTVVAGNVIDGNGEGIAISGQEDSASSGTRVTGNVITNARIRAGVESWFPGPEGRDNVVEGNCFYGGRDQIDQGGGGFVARGNRFEDPEFVNRAGKDFRLAPDSPCAAVLAAGRDGRPAPVAPELDPVTPAGVLADRSAADDEKPLRIALRRGAAIGRTRKVTVRIHPLEPVPLRTLARVEVRYGGRAWRLVAVRRVASGRASRVRLRVPRRVKGLAVRATLLKPSGLEVVTFRARPLHPGPQQRYAR